MVVEGIEETMGGEIIIPGLVLKIYIVKHKEIFSGASFNIKSYSISGTYLVCRIPFDCIESLS